MGIITKRGVGEIVYKKICEIKELDFIPQIIILSEASIALLALELAKFSEEEREHIEFEGADVEGTSVMILYGLPVYIDYKCDGYFEEVLARRKSGLF